jgi:two-component system response regulator
MLLNVQPTVLVADDSEDDRSMTVRFLRQAVPDVKIVTCADGEETLRCLLEFAQGSIESLPHLALLDMKMPKLNGDEVMERIQHERKLARMPIVLFSSSALASDVDRCVRAGVRSYVRKPTDFYEYQSVVARLCDYWLGVNLDLRTALAS